MIMKCFKKLKISDWPVLSYLFSPTDFSVVKNAGKTVFKISNFNHKYFDHQTGDRLVKVMGFLSHLKGYNYDHSMS